MKTFMNKMSRLNLSKRHALRTAAAMVLCCVSFGAMAISGTEERQSPQELRDAVKQFLLRESTGLPGTVNIEVGSIDPRLNLAPCAALETTLPAGSRLWGKVNVAVRCSEPSRWALYVQATVKVSGNYYVTAHPVQQGQTLTEADITALQGDLTSMSSGVVTELAQVLGHTSTMSLGAGIALRQDSLRLQQVVIQGQVIRLMSNGTGFRVSTDAQALNSASEGQLVKVKLNSGQVLSGVAKAGGIVEVTN